MRVDLLTAFRGLSNGEWGPLQSGLDGVLAPLDPTRPPQSPQEIEQASMVDLLDLEGLLVTVCGRPMPPPALVARYGGDHL